MCKQPAFSIHVQSSLDVNTRLGNRYDAMNWIAVFFLHMYFGIGAVLSPGLFVLLPLQSFARLHALSFFFSYSGMPIVIVLDTSLSMLRRPQPDANFTYFEVAQTLIESLVSFVRRHHFTELMALVTASSRPQLRAGFSRREGYGGLMQEVLGVTVEDKVDYVRSIAVAHNATLSEFGANEGVTTSVIFFTDEGALLHGIPEVDEERTGLEGLPFLFSGNLFMVSLQGSPHTTNDHCPFHVSQHSDRFKFLLR